MEDMTMYEIVERHDLEMITEKDAELLWHLPAITKAYPTKERHHRSRMAQRATAAAVSCQVAHGVTIS